MKQVVISHAVLLGIALHLSVSSVGWAQNPKSTATYILGDSVFEFNTSRYRLRRIPKKKVYYSFVNFRIAAQIGARADSYLHGDFENRSNTTNWLFAKGEFSYGLKHGEWKIWDTDGTLKSIERWQKGKLKKHKHPKLIDKKQLPETTNETKSK
jgi:hypothetical protein